MVDKIRDIKNQVLTHIDKQLKERGGIENVNVAQYGQMVDMVKDLAEAEEKCWKAQYYRNLVSDAMEQKYGGSTDYKEVTALVERVESSSPGERERILNELRMKVGM